MVPFSWWRTRIVPLPNTPSTYFLGAAKSASSRGTPSVVMTSGASMRVPSGSTPARRAVMRGSTQMPLSRQCV